MRRTNPTRRPFADPDPSKGPDPKTFPLERDIAIFKRLDLRRFSHSGNLRYFIGGERMAFNDRLLQLYNGGYVWRQKEKLHPDSIRSRNLVYSLTEKGRRVLKGEGISLIHASTKQYPHEFLGSMVVDSIEIGAALAGYRYIDWDQLQHDKRVHARHSDYPLSVKLPSGRKYRADGTPAIIVNPDPGKSDKCIHGYEWCRDTEPNRSSDLREKWQDKFLSLKELFQHRVFTSHFGFPNAIIPVVTIHPGHTLQVMELGHKIIGPVTYLRFKTVPDWCGVKHFPEPNGDMFDQPWHTLQDLIFDKKGNATALKPPSHYIYQ